MPKSGYTRREPSVTATIRGCLRWAAFILGSLVFLANASQTHADAIKEQEAGARVPKVGRTLVFARGQFKYPLYGNYTRRWLDRPLLHDRSLLGANEPYLHINFACFSRMVEIGRGCEMDGFAFFPSNPGRHFTPEGKKASLHKFSDRAYKEGFALLPEFGAALDKE